MEDWLLVRNTHNQLFVSVSLFLVVCSTHSAFLFIFHLRQQTTQKRFKIAGQMCNRFGMCKWRSKYPSSTKCVPCKKKCTNYMGKQTENAATTAQNYVHLLYYLSSCNSSLIFIVLSRQRSHSHFGRRRTFRSGNDAQWHCAFQPRKHEYTNLWPRSTSEHRIRIRIGVKDNWHCKRTAK